MSARVAKCGGEIVNDDGSFGFHLKAISQRVSKLLFRTMSLKNYSFQITATSPSSH